ncbi:unnamed protein product [Bursaphelenchus okinawaensis]|uniref:Uncharacterized protein n=1 Tax=Bursaphelenchus okinawaensis TaxID=465554 RepID=A0A811LG94_9BILA|nr:unnamed protein product [Bursaphelenchus okinawaensis]CAG9124621.1 unnamed protein product [Bursaphelenchus okinawaensis]
MCCFTRKKVSVAARRHRPDPQARPSPPQPNEPHSSVESPELVTCISSSNKMEYTGKDGPDSDERKKRKILQYKKRDVNGKTVDEDAESITAALRARGHEVDRKQIETVLHRKVGNQKITAKIMPGDTIFELPSRKKKKKGAEENKKKDDDTDRSEVMKTAEDQQEPEEVFEDQEGDDVTSENYMFHDSEIRYVTRLMIQESDVAHVLDGNTPEDKKIFKDMLNLIPTIPWNPYRKVEEMTGKVEKFVFNCDYLRRNSFLTMTTTGARGDRPKVTRKITSKVTLSKKILPLSEFPTPSQDIKEADIEDEDEKLKKALLSLKSKKELRSVKLKKDQGTVKEKGSKHGSKRLVKK